MLYIIGLGLGNEKDITLKGLEAIKMCDVVYLENYTSKLQCDVKALEKMYGMKDGKSKAKNLTLAERKDVEGDESKGENPILKDAASKKADGNEKNVALLVIGDPMGATTHTDIMLRCVKLGIKLEVIHNASIMNAIGIVGLELYKYGKTTSIPFPEKNFQPETAYDVIKQNMKNGLHTLCLLDLRPSENRFMSVNDALKILIGIGNKKVKEVKEKKAIFTELTLCIGCARIGSDYKIKAGKAKDLLKIDFGAPPHCLIIPGKLHFVEEDAIGIWK
jgi:diphthine synthase